MTLFGTDGIRGRAYEHPMTADVAYKIGRVAGGYFKSDGGIKVVIGRDTRESGLFFEYYLEQGVKSLGGQVIKSGVVPTPAVSFLTKRLKADAGIMITASHNPHEDNGIKIFDSKGFKLTDEVESKLEKLFSREEILKDLPAKRRTNYKETVKRRYNNQYIKFVLNIVNNLNLKGKKIVVDAAHGAMTYIAPRVFKELGAKIIVINDKPNGCNINCCCGAVHPEAVSKAVRKHKADIGFCFDGDGDRVLVSDEQGKIVGGDHIAAYCAIDLKKVGKLAKNQIVITNYSNLAMDSALLKKGIKTIRVKNGDRYITRGLVESGSNFGGEFSGHFIHFDYTPSGDGMISALQLLNSLLRNKHRASEINKAFKPFHQTLLSREVGEKIDFREIPGVERLTERIESSLGQNGRTLVRYSGTQNMVRVLVEGKNKKEVRDYAESIAREIKKYTG